MRDTNASVRDTNESEIIADHSYQVPKQVLLHPRVEPNVQSSKLVQAIENPS